MIQPSLIPNSSPVAPHNRLGLNYREVPLRKAVPPGGIMDAHCHARDPEQTAKMVEAARAYGVTQFFTMVGLEHVAGLREKFSGTFNFIAVPNWMKIFRDNAPVDEAFLIDWMDRLDQFYAVGSRLFKLHNAPFSIRRFGMNLDHPNTRRIAEHAYQLGYHFMTHVGDPKAWFFGKGKYADGTWGTFESQFEALDRFLERYPDRIHLGAHMGGSLESLDLLARRLDRFPHYVIDSSATKWIVRAVAEGNLSQIRDFVIAYQDRILFGSDLVVGEKYDFDHYASRYWAHLKLWETNYAGECPIEDPDAGQGFNPVTGIFDAPHADNIPRLHGLDLPAAVLEKLYRGNAERWLPRADYSPKW